ncbi:hypothetical protein J6590_086464, partial [Homalodisca vitripennis]
KVGRLARWIERILNLPFEVEFKSSTDNALADALSRMFEGELTGTADQSPSDCRNVPDQDKNRLSISFCHSNSSRRQK